MKSSSPQPHILAGYEPKQRTYRESGVHRQSSCYSRRDVAMVESRLLSGKTR